MLNSHEAHCQYCMIPKDLWKPVMKTYNGDECKLYSDFLDVICKIEEVMKPFNNFDIIMKCRESFESDYTDIKDFEACIIELINIFLDVAAFSDDYKPVAICK